jgi:hypothetical protein
MANLELQHHAAKRLDELPFEVALLRDLVAKPTLMAGGDAEAAERDRQTHKRNLAKLLEERRKWKALLGLEA